MLRFYLLIFISLIGLNASSAQDAIYSLDFNSNWNSVTHPTNYPSAAHWSSLVGTTHNANVNFWEHGQLASEGVEQVAENGVTANLMQEIEAEITNNNAYLFINLPLGFGETFSFENIPVDLDFPYISLMTMVAPSPDWLAEITNLKLTDDFGNWKTSISIDVYATDSGTDSGLTYISPDEDTSPPENIHSLQNTPPFSNQIVATFSFALDQILSVDDNLLENAIHLYPNPSNGILTIYNPMNIYINKVEIYTVSGKKIREVEVFNNQKKLDIKTLHVGLYFLKLDSEKGRIIKKLIIQ